MSTCRQSRALASSSTKPGLGIVHYQAAMADQIGHDWTNPQTFDEEDGSVVDW
jgi:hypothetical protein